MSHHKFFYKCMNNCLFKCVIVCWIVIKWWARGRWNMEWLMRNLWESCGLRYADIWGECIVNPSVLTLLDLRPDRKGFSLLFYLNQYCIQTFCLCYSFVPFSSVFFLLSILTLQLCYPSVCLSSSLIPTKQSFSFSL